MNGNNLNAEDLRRMLLSASERIIENEPLLTEIDTVIGDGDHGTGMKGGFGALARELEAGGTTDPADLFHQCGITLVRTMGGASGVLFGTLLIGGLAAIRGKQTLTPPDLTAFFTLSLAAIKRRGRTDVGDKTMIDALAQAVEAMREHETTFDEWAAAALAGARAGAQATKGMMPRAGRSKNFREKAVGTPDPGAVSVALFFEGIYQYLGGVRYNGGEGKRTIQ